MVFFKETVHHHSENFSEGQSTKEFIKGPQTHSFQWKADPFKHKSENFLQTIQMYLITLERLEMGKFSTLYKIQDGSPTATPTDPYKHKSFSLVCKPSATQKEALLYKHEDRSHFPFLLTHKPMHSSRNMVSLLSKVYYSLFLSTTLLTSVLTGKYVIEAPSVLWWMWLLSEVYSEHHRHWHFTRRWVLDRHNPLKRLLQKHAQKSRYCIYKDNRKSAEISIKWQSSRSVISRFY